MGTFWQLSEASTQTSTVQSTESAQSGGVPRAQRPSVHVSAPLHQKPSSHSASPVQRVGGTQPLVASQTIGLAHAPSFGVFTQPPSASEQASTVQSTESAQSGGVPAAQAPASQVSAPLQAKPSSQSPSVVHGSRGTQPSMGEHSSDAAQRA